MAAYNVFPTAGMLLWKGSDTMLIMLCNFPPDKLQPGPPVWRSGLFCHLISLIQPRMRSTSYLCGIHRWAPVPLQRASFPCRRWSVRSRTRRWSRALICTAPAACPCAGHSPRSLWRAPTSRWWSPRLWPGPRGSWPSGRECLRKHNKNKLEVQVIE